MAETTKRSNAEIADEYCALVSDLLSGKKHVGHAVNALEEAAAALRAPTIAALEPLQLTESEAAELDAFRAKPSRAEGLTFTPVPTIAAPSPSNEVTPEMVEAALKAYFEEQHDSEVTGIEFDPEDFTEADRREMRVAIEAALAVHNKERAK